VSPLFFCIVRETYTRTEETGPLLYFALFKLKILRVPEFLSAFVPAIIEYKDIIPVNHKFFNIKLFDIVGIWPAPYFIFFDINVIVTRAGESKPVGEKGLQQVPVFFLIGSINTSNHFFVCGLATVPGKVAAKQNNSDAEYVPDRFFFEFIFHQFDLFL
jgi:hypothetical protein